MQSDFDSSTKNANGPEWFDRARNAYFHDDPESRFHDAAKFGDRLSGIFKALGLENETAADKLAAQWTAMTSAEIARHSRPRKILSGGRLVVGVNNSAWYAELSRFWSDELLKRVQSVEPGVKKLIFSLETGESRL